VYAIEQYAKNFVSDLRQVGGFPQVLPFPPPMKPHIVGSVFQIKSNQIKKFYLKSVHFYNSTT